MLVAKVWRKDKFGRLESVEITSTMSNNENFAQSLKRVEDSLTSVTTTTNERMTTMEAQLKRQGDEMSKILALLEMKLSKENEGETSASKKVDNGKKKETIDLDDKSDNEESKKDGSSKEGGSSFSNDNDKKDNDKKDNDKKDNDSKNEEKKDDPKVLSLEARMELIENKSKGNTRRFNSKTVSKNLLDGLPKDFKFPEIPKFDGSGDAASHIKIYFFAMTRAGAQEKHMVLWFGETLKDCASEWYGTLPKGTQDNWDLLCDAFQTQFEDNLQVKPTRRDLEHMLQEPNETFAAFATRWKKKLLQVVDRPSTKEQLDILLKCCTFKYRRDLTGPNYETFNQLYDAGLKFDELYRDSKMYDKKATPYSNNSYGGTKRATNAPTKEANSIYNVSNATSAFGKSSPNGGKGQTNRFPKKPREFTNLGNLELRDVFLTLKEDGKIKPLEGYAPSKIHDKWKHNEYCEYHQHSGHTTNNCINLRHLVQNLIEKGEITTKPNVINNPLPHNVSGSNVIGMVDVNVANEATTHLVPHVGEGEPSYFNGNFNSCYVVSFDDIEERTRVRKGGVNVLTRTGRGIDVTPPPPPNANNASSSNAPPEDPMLTLLKKVNSQVSIWDLLVASKAHRDNLLKALAQIPISANATPDQVVQMVGTINYSNIISFTDLELPPYGNDHNDALYICLSKGNLKIPKVLVDNGSAVNLLPRRLMNPLRLEKANLRPSSQTIRGYDCASRPIMGETTLTLMFGDVEMDVDFLVIDIASSFNLLLGRPWLHKIGGIASSLHQMVKFKHGNEIVVIHGESLMAKSKDDNHLLAIQHSPSDLFVSGFQLIDKGKEIVNMVDAKNENEKRVWETAYSEEWFVNSKSKVLKIMRKMEYFPGMGLGKNQQGPLEFPDPRANKGSYGLGYKPMDNGEENESDVCFRLMMKKRTYDQMDQDLSPYRKTLNGYFVREGEKIPYFMFPEPWCQNGVVKPGFEIFNDCELDEEIANKVYNSTIVRETAVKDFWYGYYIVGEDLLRQFNALDMAEKNMICNLEEEESQNDPPSKDPYEEPIEEVYDGWKTWCDGHVFKIIVDDAKTNNEGRK